MTPSSLWMAAALAAVAMAGRPAAATDLDGVRLDDSAQVAGRQLMLNGAGIVSRLLFRVYAVSLYLPDRKHSAREVLSSDGPRRLHIVMLCDVGGGAFAQAVAEFLPVGAGHEAAHAPSRIAEPLLQLTRAIAALPEGLRKGDTLTLDWVPGTGALIALNQRPVIAPQNNPGFYSALLGIWLGETPADARLKTQLLGSAQARQT